VRCKKGILDAREEVANEAGEAKSMRIVNAKYVSVLRDVSITPLLIYPYRDIHTHLADVLRTVVGKGDGGVGVASFRDVADLVGNLAR
jgi:hypothetical protein